MRSVLRGWAGGLLAALLVLAVGLYGDPLHRAWQADHASAVGEHRSVSLADGSRVLLGPDSSLRLEFSAAERRVELLRGVAEFDVQTDPARPFVVAAGALEATAVGTRYRVSRLVREQSRVQVDEGRVAVVVDGRPLAVLTAGERALRGSRGWRVEPAPGSGTDWRDGLLVFDGEPLQYVLASLAPYSEGRLWLGERARRNTPVTLAVPVDDAAAALHSLAARHGLQVRRLPTIGVLVY